MSLVAGPVDRAGSILRLSPILVLVLIVAGCGGVTATGQTGTASPRPTPTGSPADPDAAVITLRLGGGLAPQPADWSIPEISLWADGLLIAQGAREASSPGPALPPVQAIQVDPQSMPLVLGILRDGLAGLPADFGLPGVADAPSVEVTWRGDGGQRVYSAYALGLVDDRPGDMLTAEQVAARARLASVVDYLRALAAGTLDSVSTTPAGPYEATAWLVWARPFTGGGGTSAPELEWPGPALSGEGSQPGCHVLTGAQAVAAGTALEGAYDVTPWRSGGRLWALTVRPLLPGEEARCPA